MLFQKENLMYELNKDTVKCDNRFDVEHSSMPMIEISIFKNLIVQPNPELFFFTYQYTLD